MTGVKTRDREGPVSIRRPARHRDLPAGMNEAQDSRTFRSAVDLWLWLLALGLPLAILLWVGALVLSEGGGSVTVMILLVVSVVTLGVPLWILLDTRYTVDAGALHIRSGPLRTRIALDDIRSVRPSRSLLAAPALSLDRLEIRCGRHGSILVSPRERVAFLTAIGHPAGGSPPAQAAS